MRNFLKFHTLLLGVALCLSAVLSFWALERDSCFEVNVDGRVNIKAGCQIEL